MPMIRLAAVRVNADKTQDEWAELMGVAKSTVCNWESGKTIPNLQKIRKMSELSGIPIDLIFVPEKAAWMNRT